VKTARAFDLIVVGGGPAGLATAIEAARHGMAVAVIERRDGVIDKACGEGLMPPAVRELREMGVEIAGGRPFAGIRYVADGAAAEARFRGSHGVGLRRTALHEALAARAADLGVVRVAAEVAEVRQTAEYVEAGGLRGRWLAAADGLHSRIRRSLRLAAPPRHPPRHGIRRHFRAEPWSDLVEVHWDEEAEAYVTPVGEELVGVAVLFTGRGSFDVWLARFPSIAARLGPAASAPQGAGPFEQRVTRRVVGRVALVGDAAGFLDPLTGEGVGLGIAAGQVLVRCLVGAEGIEAYERQWQGLTRRYRFITAALLRLRRAPALRRRLVPVLQRCPSLFDFGLRFLVGPGSGC
jgi:flavin-dependent dehydrogenase